MGFATLRTREITADPTKSCFPNTTRTASPNCSTATANLTARPVLPTLHGFWSLVSIRTCPVLRALCEEPALSC